MKKSPLIFLLCIAVSGFIFKNEIISRISVISASWASLPNLPYTLSHNVTVAADTAGNKILIMGGIAGDSITSRVISYNIPGAVYDTSIPKLPRRLMNGFGFRIKDSIYYGGGYTTNWKDTSLTSDTLYDCFRSPTGVTYVSGQRGKIFYSSNNGVSWLTRPLPDTTKNVVGISFASDSVGWIVVNKHDTDAAVYSTTNKGVTWTSSLSGSHYNDIFFTDANTGWVCGNTGKIQKTTNGGSTWIVQNFGSDNNQSIHFVNTSTGYISCSNGKVIKTTNGGTSWITQSTGTTKSLNSITFYDASTGYAAGDSGAITKTTNGGTGWTIQRTNTSLNLRSIEKMNANKVIVSGDRGIIIFTTNAGTEWVQRVGVSSNRLNKVCIAPGDSIATAVGVNGLVTKAYKPFFEYMIMDMFYKINVNNLAAGWQTKAALPISIAEVFSSACTLNDRFAYVFGGRTSGSAYSDSVLMYNHFSNTWSFKRKLPAKLSETGVAVVGKDKIIVAGGKKSDSISSKVYIGTVDSMNAGSPGSITWAAGTTDLPVPTYAMGSKGFPSKNIAFFIGGNTSLFSFAEAPSDPSTKIFVYDFRTGAFTELQTDVANVICHTGVDGCLSEIPFSNSAAPDTSVRIFAPGGRDSNYISLNLHKVLKVNGLVSVQAISAEIPAKYFLSQNYPNPFNPATKIRYELPKSDFVVFKVFDLLGKEISAFTTGFQKAGVYEVTFDGNSLASGVYFYQLKTGNFSYTRRMLLLK